MMPAQIRRALRETENEIIGIKAQCRRNYGKGPRSKPYPIAIIEKLNRLREQANQYRVQLRTAQ